MFKSKFRASTSVVSSFLFFCTTSVAIGSNLVIDVNTATASPESLCRKIKRERAKTIFGTNEYEKINDSYETNDCNKVLYRGVARYTEYLRGEQKKIDDRNQYLNQDQNCLIFGRGTYNPATRSCQFPPK
jgi:hypothetical protein